MSLKVSRSCLTIGKRFEGADDALEGALGRLKGEWPRSTCLKMGASLEEEEEVDSAVLRVEASSAKAQGLTFVPKSSNLNGPALGRICGCQVE